MDQLSTFIPSFPDATLRRALTLTDIAPVILCYYAHAVMAILPNTYWLRVALLPVTEWFVWNSAVTLDFSKYLAGQFGLENPLRISFLNMMFDVSALRLGRNLVPWLTKADLSPRISLLYGL